MRGREPVRIAARSSELAQQQTRWVAERLTALGRACVLIDVAMPSDPTASGTWRGVGVLVTSPQAAVRENRADLAVRPFDELPVTPAEGLQVAAVPERAAAHDLLLLRPEAFDPAAGVLPVVGAARIGVNAAHRTSQLHALRPDLRLAAVHGGTATRVAALRTAQGYLGGVVVAAVAVDGLGLDLEGLRRVDLDPTVVLPAPGQGALALEVRRGDPLTEVLQGLHDERTFVAVAAERTLLGLLPNARQPDLAAYGVRLPGGFVSLAAWLDGHRARVRAGSSDEVAMQAYDQLGRPRRSMG